MEQEKILEVKNLRMYYSTLRGDVRAVDDVSFNLDKEASLGLVGESGCGKTSAMLAILKLLPWNGRIIDGEIYLDEQNILKMPDTEFRKKIRWKKVSTVFQGAMNALHPMKTIGDQITEAITLHGKESRKEALKRAKDLLELVGIRASLIDRYPHELSGGMKQRCVIAMSVACDPQLVILDEPTTALDVIIAAQVLKLIIELQKKLKLSIIIVTHDLSMVSEVCDNVAVMYGGKMVEIGDIMSVYKEPLHPYSQKLISAFPSVLGPKQELQLIPGFPPNLLEPPTGCRFHPRCPYSMDVCRKKEPPLLSRGKQHSVACHLIGD